MVDWLIIKLIMMGMHMLVRRCFHFDFEHPHPNAQSIFFKKENIPWLFNDTGTWVPSPTQTVSLSLPYCSHYRVILDRATRRLGHIITITTVATGAIASFLLFLQINFQQHTRLTFNNIRTADNHPWIVPEFSNIHYNDVIMGAIASQITGLTIVYSTSRRSKKT